MAKRLTNKTVALPFADLGIAAINLCAAKTLLRMGRQLDSDKCARTTGPPLMEPMCQSFYRWDCRPARFPDPPIPPRPDLCWLVCKLA